MNRRRIPGAIRLPAFLMIWTAAVVVVTLQVHEAGVRPAAPAAAPAATASRMQVDLPAPPELADPAAWSTAMAQLARRSEVMNGSWQPPARSLPRIHPVATVVPADAPGDTPASVMASAALAPAVADERVVKTPAARFARFDADKSRARDALRGGRFAAAYALLRPRVGEARHDSEYLGLLALAAMRLGSHGEALVLYQRLAAIEPASGRWRMGLALAQESLGLDASREYRQALALADDADGIRRLLVGRLADEDVT